MTRRGRGHMRLTPSAWHIHRQPTDEPGKVTVVSKTNLRRMRREQRKREREQTPSDQTATAAAESKRERRRDRNLTGDAR